MTTTVKNYFGDKNGFGTNKQVAIDLLKTTIKILKKFKINHFLISGSLLGYVRHNGFIPWDDDIDLIVDETILEKLPTIYKRFKNQLVFYNRENFLIKTCFKDKVLPIKIHAHKQFLLNKNDTYNWPFIDLFVYKIYGDNLNFFNKNWDVKSFFPSKQVDFEGVQVSVPNDPHYFLNINYNGDNYMEIIRSSMFIHKYETPITIRASMSFKQYLSQL